MAWWLMHHTALFNDTVNISGYVAMKVTISGQRIGKESAEAAVV
jgi:hypothetical protein